MHLYDRYFGEEQAPAITEQTTSTTSTATSDSPASASAPKAAPQKAASASTRADLYRTGWAELPAEMENDDLYYAHHISKEEARRNYTVCFSSSHCCPLWVAYPLHNSYKGEAKRSDSFGYDPTLSIDIQPLLRHSFGEYTRGHLIGSAERSSSTEMNKQTFYASNIAPQIQSGFNASNGAWNNIENFVARQMCADTLYVVTGCLFDDFNDTGDITIKASTTTNKNDGKTISVPTAFYKVLLRTRKGDTGRSVYDCNSEELQCAAFVVGHRSATGRKAKDAQILSVSELEQITGIEFFAGVSNAPKDVINPQDWGLK